MLGIDHTLLVAAYHILGVPEGSAHDAKRNNGFLFSHQDVGSVFWIGIEGVYVCGLFRPTPGVAWHVPVGTIAVCVSLTPSLSFVTIQCLNVFPNSIVTVRNPVVK